MDALEELAHLSLALQKTDVTLPVAQRLLARQLEVFVARKSTEGEYYGFACKAVNEQVFFGVQVAESTGKEKEINKNQFYQSLCDSIRARLLPENERALSKAIAILDSTSWPSRVDPEYGEKDLRVLCQRFGISFVEVKHQFRDFKDSGGDVAIAATSLQQLFNAVNTVPVSTSECERGFSRMNLVCTSRPVSDSPAVFSLARRQISLAFLAEREEREKGAWPKP